MKSFVLLLQSTNQRSKLVESTEKTYRSQLNGIAEQRYAAKRKEPLSNCCNWPLDGGWIPWWIATICEKYLRKGASTNQLSQRIFIWFVVEIPPISGHSIVRNTVRIRLVRRWRSLERNSYGSRRWAGGQKIDASEFFLEKLNAKEMISPNLVTIPKTADGQLKIIEGDQVLRTSTSTEGQRTQNERKF